MIIELSKCSHKNRCTIDRRMVRKNHTKVLDDHLGETSPLHRVYYTCMHIAKHIEELGSNDSSDQRI